MQIVTLTTDFGIKDYYLAMLKGNILKKASDIQIIDISHKISTHDIVEGAFFLKNAYQHFPIGTIHVASVQSYATEGNSFIVFEKDGYYFMGPDNGFFSLIFEDIQLIKKYEITMEADSHFLHHTISKGVAHLSQNLPLEELGKPIEKINEKIALRPVITNSHIRATITHIDHFGNITVNLSKEVFEKERKGRNYLIYYKGKDPIDRISKNYSDAEIGDVLCIFNSAGLMEISINMGNAHELLSLRKNETIQIDFID